MIKKSTPALGFTNDTCLLVNRLRWSCLATLLVVLSVALLRADFFNKPFFIGHDTESYTNVPGISEGASLANFSSDMRTPGYSLFFFLATLGEIPHRDAVRRTACGDSVWGDRPDCEEVMAGSDDTVVRIPPFVYSFSKRVEGLLQRAIVASRVVFVLSIIFLFWALSYWINPILSLLSVLLFVWAYVSPSRNILDVLHTESLYPALLFVYLSCMALYFIKGRGFWLVLASAVAVFTYLVRPAFLYLPAIHVLFLVYFAFFRKALASSSIGALVVVSPIIWVFWFSPVDFYSINHQLTRLMRAAMFSDQQTVDCVKDHDAKTVLSAYMGSIYAEPSLKAQAASLRNDIDRYYAFSLANIHRLNLPNHPIYKDPSIKPLLDGASGLLPNELVDRMARAAGRCNVWRDAQFFILTTRMMLGLTPVLTPHAPRYFFKTRYTFYVSALMIALALMMLCHMRRYRAAVLIALPVAIYFVMVFIVAFTQGGEARYTITVEPLYVLSVAIACSLIFQALLAYIVPFARARFGGRKDASTGSSG
jgi:hypothetical protein